MGLLRRVQGTPQPTNAAPAPAPPAERPAPAPPAPPPQAKQPPAAPPQGKQAPPAAPQGKQPPPEPAKAGQEKPADKKPMVGEHGTDEEWEILATTGHRFRDLKNFIATRMLQELGADFQPKYGDPTHREKLLPRFYQLYAETNATLTSEEQQELYDAVLDEVVGFGPIEPLLRNDAVSEVMVNGPRLTYTERKGKLQPTDVRFENDEHVMRVVKRILDPLGRRVDRKWPLVDARLPDGSRVNAIVPPCALNGPTVTIRKFSKKPLTVENLIQFGSMTREIAEFLRACVLARLNVVVSGGTGSGKTTLLNVLSGFVPDDERIITVEDSAELQLRQRHVVTLEARPADPDGTGRVAIRDLVINTLRMRPERIIVGECRGGETLDMLQAMNTGHDGSLTTLHANTPRDAVARMETMAMMAGMALPLRVIREQIAGAVDLIVQQTRLRDGSRKITYVTEVQGMEGEIVVLQDVFKFVEKGVTEEGKVIGGMEPQGIRPKFMPRLESKGIFLAPEVFGVRF